MTTALAISPHLDDAVFSCGGILAGLARRGWRVVVATAFTRSVWPAHGFALACQRDKGLADEVDYMALRRREDAVACAALGVEPRWLDLPEAPHRGYESAAALFAEFSPRDGIVTELAAAVASVVRDVAPDLLLAPAALGAHVDHRHVLRAALALPGDHATAFWRDVPYVMRQPGAAAADPALAGLEHVSLPIAGTLDAKIEAAAAYSSQTGFQFGGAGAMATALRTLAIQDGGGSPAERLLATRDALRLLRA